MRPLDLSSVYVQLLTKLVQFHYIFFALDNKTCNLKGARVISSSHTETSVV